MDFVDRDRRVGCLRGGARRHPLGVRPGECLGPRHHRSSSGRGLGRARQRIGLQRQRGAITADDVIFVALAGLESGHEQLPRAGAVTQPHGIAPAVPAVEIADQRNAPRIGRPHREAHTFDAVNRCDIGAEAMRQVPMCALAKEVQIEIAQQGPKGIRVFGFVHAARPLDAQDIAAGIRHRSNENAFVCGGGW